MLHGPGKCDRWNHVKSGKKEKKKKKGWKAQESVTIGIRALAEKKVMIGKK